MSRRTPRHAVPVPAGERRSLLAWLFGRRPDLADEPEPARWLDGDGPDLWLPQPDDTARPLVNGEWGGIPARDGDTQVLEGVVLPDEPQPASAPGLAPASDPATMILPVLHAQQKRGLTRVLRLAFTGPRARRAQRMFTDFDGAFYALVNQAAKRFSAVADRLAAENDEHDADLMARLAALDAAHRARVAAEGGAEYASQLAIVSGPQTARPTGPAALAPPLPRRIPGASLPPGQQHRGRRPYGAMALERRSVGGGAL